MDNIGSLFNRIAHSYDSLNHILSLNIDKRWRRCLAKTMTPVDSCLDVAIGTADLAIELIRSGKAGRVDGIDLSTEMMRIGAEKSGKRGYDITFQEASAFDIPFPDSHFPAVTCSFGCRNFSDLQRGLKEMYRVLNKGGQLRILEFSMPSNPIVRWVYNLYFAHILPTIGGLISHDKSAYVYLNKSVERFVWGERFCEELQKAGFVNATYESLSFGIAMLYSATK